MGTKTTTALPAVADQRRGFLATIGAAAVATAPLAALAEIDYANLPYLGGSDKIDINNCNVRIYSKLPGMYPGAAGKIASNGPYSSVDQIFSIPGLSSAEKNVMGKYKDRFVALEPSEMYVIDRL